MLRKVVSFLFFTVVFSTFIFFIKSTFFGLTQEHDHQHIEDEYIEPSAPEDTLFPEEYPDDLLDVQEVNSILAQALKERTQKEREVNFLYFPSYFEYESIKYKELLSQFLENHFFQPTIKDLTVALYKEPFSVRGKMQDRTVKLFGLLQFSGKEVLAVGIHEFAHYIDLYYFEKKVFTDISEYFYNISWDDTKVLKSGTVQKDFVSGYAMTNKYEDFAESFTYYILHNKDFDEKAKQSDILMEKYDFFTRYFFRNDDFFQTDFRTREELKNYYRDTTKIDFDLEKFLLFLEKGI